MAGRIAYQVEIDRPVNGGRQVTYDLFRTEEAAQEFAKDYLLKVGKADPVALRELTVVVTGPFEV